jgi:hypothetical protein
MLEALSTTRNRRRSLYFLIGGGLATGASTIVGISDNPPGIALAFGAAAAFLLAIIHPWRTARPYWRLLLATVLGFVASAILHNVFEMLGGLASLPGFVSVAFRAIGVTFFLAAVILCPPALVVSLVGAMAMALRGDHHPSNPQGRA